MKLKLSERDISPDWRYVIETADRHKKILTMADNYKTPYLSNRGGVFYFSDVTKGKSKLWHLQK